MGISGYPYELPELSIGYGALEPYIDTETMHYHYDAHYGTYIANLNKALEAYPKLQSMSLEQLLSNPGLLPKGAERAIMNNGGGVYNHGYYFSMLRPVSESGHMPTGKLNTIIEQNFGSFTEFKNRFAKQALGVFGSGYCALVLDKRDIPQIISLKNQDTVVGKGVRLILLVDVWEHAYYLKHKNRRADYIEDIWRVITFPEI